MIIQSLSLVLLLIERDGITPLTVSHAHTPRPSKPGRSSALDASSPCRKQDIFATGQSRLARLAALCVGWCALWIAYYFGLAGYAIIYAPAAVQWIAVPVGLTALTVWTAWSRAKAFLERRLIVRLEQAWDESQQPQHEWLVFIKVRITNPDPDPTTIEEWETELTFDGKTYPGRGFEPPQNSPRRYVTYPGGSVEILYADALDDETHLGPFASITRTIICGFTVDYVHFRDVTLRVRVKGDNRTISHWSNVYEPPNYPEERENPWT